jgi:succinylglutamic semialdehyde dehydrogenase
MAIFTKDKAVYEKAVSDARVGLLNWNRTTNGASSRLPFGGLGKSGNDRASGSFAIQYCSVPMASLEDPTGFADIKPLPGMNFP